MKNNSQNNVDVRVKFNNEYDGNFDCYSLRVEILYSLPSEFGFKKNKRIERYIFENQSKDDWIDKVSQLLLKGGIKKIIHKEIQEDIMKRIRFNNDNINDPITKMLHSLNQLKFHFHFDMDSAKQIIETEEEAFKTN